MTNYPERANRLAGLTVTMSETRHARPFQEKISGQKLLAQTAPGTLITVYDEHRCRSRGTCGWEQG
jgi:hypothetical protein